MIRKIRRLWDQFQLLYFFSLTIFVITIVVLGVIAVGEYFLVASGYTPVDFYTSPVTGLIVIYAACFSIAVFSIIGANWTIFIPLRKIMKAMGELSGGNFEVRVKTDEYYIKDISEFAKNFNLAAKELASIEMLRSDFVNSFSHEFKTPIVSLKGFAKLLKDGKLTESERDEYLDIIIQESDRLASLAANVLNLSKIENQLIISDLTNFDLSEQIRRIILMLESKWTEKNLELDIGIDDNVIYYGNAELLSQVWVNAVDNAIKFSECNGNLQIRLAGRADHILFEVSDSGCGMDEETKAHIFDKFYQGDRSRNIEGNGLGMAIVKSIVNMHNGSIEIDSEPNEGTAIYIKLPIKAVGT